MDKITYDFDLDIKTLMIKKFHPGLLVKSNCHVEGHNKAYGPGSIFLITRIQDEWIFFAISILTGEQLDFGFTWAMTNFTPLENQAIN